MDRWGQASSPPPTDSGALVSTLQGMVRDSPLAQRGSGEMVLMIWHLAEEIKNVAKPLTNRITEPQISVVAL